jgi:hypothetical protein
MAYDYFMVANVPAGKGHHPNLPLAEEGQEKVF